MEMMLIWIIVLVAAMVLEAGSLALVSIWFAFGALISLILASFGATLGVQCVVFVAVSLLSLICVRPFTRHFLKIRQEKTNADRILGQEAVVTVAIDNTLAQGEIQLMGQHWSATSAHTETIAKGTKVRVLSITGVRAVVEPM